MRTIGKFARYIPTGTIGKVIETKEFDGKTWILLDNGLYYDINYLETISENEFQEFNQFRNEEKTLEMDSKLKKWIKKMEEEKIDFEVVDSCGAG